MKKLGERLPSFEITGLPKPDSAPESGIGSQLSETGSPSLVNIEAATERLLQDSAESNLAKALDFLAQQCGLSMKGEYRTWDDPVYGMDFEQTGWSIVATNESPDRDGARKAVATLNVQSPERLVNVWLADLALVTASARPNDDEATARLSAYRRRLVEYPPDVVRDVLREAANKYKFFPTWHELKEDLDAQCEMRRELERLV